ncbi:MAG: cupin-like domain-containing protein [Acidobacteriia bacterium]|nr:cupin-like domain-containing protein [Terriglobia bacterium]
MKTATQGLQTLPVERTASLTPEIFHQRYLTGSGKPVIVSDALNSWEAVSRWSFDLFKARYGADRVSPKIFRGVKRVKLMTLSEFLDYLDAPDAVSPGLWIDPETLYPCAAPADPGSSPLYLVWDGFGMHPELLDDVELSPTFVEDWLPLLPPGLRGALNTTKFFSAGFMIGPKGAQIGLHYDFLQSHAYLAQIIGKKRCLLFSPEDSVALYGGKVNPDVPDFKEFPLFRNVTAYQCTLEPGELLFMPCGWWHHVVSLEKSVTVNYNFFNRVNFSGYLTHLLREMPLVVSALEQLPDQRAALGIKWKSRGFDFPESGVV